jgi:hypothetical protein
MRTKTIPTVEDLRSLRRSARGQRQDEADKCRKPETEAEWADYDRTCAELLFEQADVANRILVHGRRWRMDLTEESNLQCAANRHLARLMKGGAK